MSKRDFVEAVAENAGLTKKRRRRSSKSSYTGDH